MRSEEFIPDQINEDWKKVANSAIGAGVAGAMALGAYGLSPKKNSVSLDDIATQVQQTQHSPESKLSNFIPKMKHALSSPLGKELIHAATSAGLKNNELFQFLGQCAHESDFFRTMKERGGPKYFRQYDPDVDPAKAKLLGNIKKGDGNRYHGRGFIQLTGRDNYKRAGKALGLPLEQHPEMAEKPAVAAKLALWYWQTHVRPKVSDFSDTRAATKPINRGLHMLKDRNDAFNAVKQLFQTHKK